MIRRALNFTLYLLVTLTFVSCHTNMSREQTDEGSIVSEDRILIDSPESSHILNPDTVMIFGVKAPKREIELLEELQQNGILTIDSVSSDENGFRYAIIEFAGVKFGMNNGYSFLTSRKDKAAIKGIVKKISEYYGDPWIDEEDEEVPQYQYYFWNTTNPDKPSIRVRPLHTEEGGLVMFWEF